MLELKLIHVGKMAHLCQYHQGCLLSYIDIREYILEMDEKKFGGYDI